MQVKEMIKVFRMMPSSTQSNLVKEFVDELSQEHRTNQASVIRTLQHILFQYAQTMEDRTDLRNQAAVEFAKKVSQIHNPIPYI